MLLLSPIEVIMSSWKNQNYSQKLQSFINNFNNTQHAQYQLQPQQPQQHPKQHQYLHDNKNHEYKPKLNYPNSNQFHISNYNISQSQLQEHMQSHKQLHNHSYNQLQKQNIEFKKPEQFKHNNYNKFQKNKINKYENKAVDNKYNSQFEHEQPLTILQKKISSLCKPEKDYSEIYKQFEKHDKKYLIQPKSIDETLKEIFNDMEDLNITNNFNFSHVQGLLAKINYMNLVDRHNGFKIKEILKKVWRFVKNYNLTNKIVFYDTLAGIANTDDATEIASTLVMFYIPHMKNTDALYHKLYISN